MPDIYDQHRTTFPEASAYVVTNAKGELVAKVAFRRSRRSGRVTCFLHVMGVRMVKGVANGGGYDMASAAIFVASRKIDTKDQSIADRDVFDVVAAFQKVLTDGGYTWDHELRSAGLNVLQAL